MPVLFCRTGSWPLLFSYSLGLSLANIGFHLSAPFLFWPALLLSMVPFQRRWKTIVFTAATVLLFIFLGQYLYHQAMPLNAPPLPPDKQLITATVARLEPQPQRWRMDVDVLTPQALAGQRMRIHVLDTNCPALPGDTVQWRGKVRRPRRFGTPGEFNYPRYLANLEIYASGYITSAEQITILENKDSRSPLVLVERWRSLLGQQIAARIHHPHTAFLISLVLGEKSRLNTEQRDQLARLGLSHLFAISGLHLGLLATFLYVIVQKFYRRSTYALLLCPLQQAVPILILPPLLFYLLLSGGALPTWRAGLLIALVAWLNLRYRQVRAEDILSSIALLILLVKPLALFGASFQLSFCGVAALILVLPSWQHQLKQRWQRWFLLPPLVTLTATLATLPVALWHFHLLAPAALLNNLFAVPAIGLIALPAALIATILFTLSLPGATILFNASATILDSVLSLSDTISQGLLKAQLVYWTPSHLLLVAGLCLTALALLARQRRLSLFPMAATLIGGLALTFFSPASPALRLTALSVGQGDCLLLQQADGTNYLIDGGGLYSRTFDVGERLVAPALGHLGIHRLDAVILSHDHPDHRKGLIHILQNFPVGAFWCSVPPSELHASLQQVLQIRHIPIRVFPAGWSEIENGREQSMSVFVAPLAHNKNDHSLVVYARDQDQGVLLCGDLEQHGVAQLVADPPPGPTQVIKLPHHGSRHSAPDHLLTSLQPRWVIASVGYRNRYRFPHTAVIEAVNAIPASLLRTDRDGSLQLTQVNGTWQLHHLSSPLPWP